MNSQPSDEDAPDTINLRSVAEAFASAEQKAKEIQAIHAQAAQYAGYVSEAIHALAPFYTELAEHSDEIPAAREFVFSGAAFANSIRDGLHEVLDPAAHLVSVLHTSASAVNTFASSSDTAGLLMGIAFKPPEPPPFFAANQSYYEEQLSRIDPSLADTYREIKQVYYGTTADPKRAAIMLMRQTFDHFFGILAPEDSVRASPFWKPKPGPEPDQVTRRERMTYAARTHIKVESLANTIIESFDNILHTYKMLNNLHKRGALSEEAARSALKTMQKFIETWVDAIIE